ncbi:MAG: c-type cytochrome [Planctomycetes bacterium]|nr:c-type cytochrome [Planctomycetota bacterium]
MAQPADGPAIAVFEGALGLGAIANGAPAANARDFGARDIAAGPGNPVTIVIENSGAADLSLGAPALAGQGGEFLLDAASMLTLLTPGANTAFTVAFDPATAGQKTATVSFTHNGANSSTPFSFSVTGTGADGALPALTPNISVAGPASAPEGNSGASTFSFTVSLSAATSLTVSVNYATTDLTALGGQDYTDAAGVLTFSAGQTSKAVAVSVIGDATVESDEQFSLDLSGASNGVIVGASATATILNDDSVAGVVSYAADIQPIFNARCVSCHPSDAGLNLTSYSRVMSSGKVVAGDSAASKIYRVVSGSNPSMPPSGGPLTAAQVKAIKDWIDAGALNN